MALDGMHSAGQSGHVADHNQIDTTLTAHAASIAAKLDSATAASTYATKGAVVLNVKDYGATGNGTTDDTAAIQATINAAVSAGGGIVFVPQGNYKTTSVLTISGAAVEFVGAGVGPTTITLSSLTGDLLHIDNYASWSRVSDMFLTRSALATSGAGISTSGIAGSEAQYLMISRVHVKNHGTGLDLGPATQGFVYDVLSEGNNGVGVRMTASATNGTMQWDLVNVLAQANNSHGFHVFAPGTGATSIILGQWLRCKTFSNSGHGVFLQGAAACPIYDWRCSDSFFGEDGNDEIFLSTYGGNHHIVNTFCEYAGSGTTGASGTTAATLVGAGINIDSTNTDVSIIGGEDLVNSGCGTFNNGARTTISGRHFKSNGAAGGSFPGVISGVYNYGGQLNMTGCTAWGQGYGVYTHVDSILVVGNDLGGFTTAATGSDVTLTASILANNLTA